MEIKRIFNNETSYLKPSLIVLKLKDKIKNYQNLEIILLGSIIPHCIKINLAELVSFTTIKFIYMVAMAFGHSKILLHFLMKTLSNGIFFIITVIFHHLEDGSPYIIY